jgi:Zn-dependent protease
MTGISAASTTPILDSGIPAKRKSMSLAAIAFGLVTGVPSAAVLIAASNRASATHNPAADFMLVNYFLALLLAVVAHELGHLAAGWMVGFHFNSITIGPFSLHMEYGRMKLRIRRTMPAGGYAGMQIDRVSRLRRRLLIFSVGGPLANLLSAAITWVFLAYTPVNGTWLSAFADLFGMISLILGVANLLPFRLGVLYPDGARIWMLWFSRAKARRWLCNAGLGVQGRAGKRPRELRGSWLRAATAVRDDSVDEFAANWLVYFAATDRKDQPLAACHLERCLELVGSLGPSLRDLVALEATVFTAWFRRDAALAEKWRERIKRPKAIPQLMQLRAEIAFDCAYNEFTSALRRLESALAIVDKLPPTPVRKRLRDGLTEWRDEIRERQQSYCAVGDSAPLAQPTKA